MAHDVQVLRWTLILSFHCLVGGALTAPSHLSVLRFVLQEHFQEAQAVLSLSLASHLHRAWAQTSARKSTKAIAAKTGVIVALPHAGNWDHAGAYFCAKGVPLVTVAERLKPEKLFLKFLSYRESMGMEVLPLDGRVLETLADRLRAGALVALVADRDLSRSGIEVQFFGAPARMPAGPALLAIRTQAPLITAFVSYTDTGVHIDFQSVMLPSSGSEREMVQEIVQMTAVHFEDGISQRPQDWHMLQRIWTDGDFKERS